MRIKLTTNIGDEYGPAVARAKAGTSHTVSKEVGDVLIAKGLAVAAQSEVAEQKLEPEQKTTNWEAMTVQELRQYASGNEINLHGATHKDEIIAAIVEASQ